MVWHWIYDEDNVDNTLIFWLLLSSDYTKSRTFHITLPVRSWGYTRTEREQDWNNWPRLTKGMPYTRWCHAQQWKWEEVASGWLLLLLGDWLGISWLVVKNGLCSTCYIYSSCCGFFPFPFLFFFFFLNKASEPAHLPSSILGAEKQAPAVPWSQWARPWGLCTHVMCVCPSVWGQ